MKPKNIEPQSPIKIEAGLKLNSKKPMTALPNTAGKIASEVCPPIKNVMQRKTQEMTDTPPASPSMLSKRLIALVMPTSQKMVMKSLMTSEPVSVNRTPK